MTHPLDGALLKVRRARVHLADLQVQTRAFTDQQPYHVELDQDVLTGHYVVRLRVSGEPIPLRLGLIAGDVVHNLRSALDHLVWQLAGEQAATSATQFPIFDNAEEYAARSPAMLRGVGAAHVARIEALQPYHFKAAADADVDAIASHPGALARNFYLLAIGRLDNADKHRNLVAATAVLPFRKPEFVGVRRARGTFPADLVRAVDGAELYRITEIEVWPGSPKVELKTPLVYSIAFGDLEFGPHGSPGDIWSDRTKGAVSAADLGSACDAVEEIVSSFAPDL